MAEGCIYIYTGDGRGKSPAAIGRAVQAAVEGKRVVIIQFLKGKGLEDSDFLRRMEPEIKLFRFENRTAILQNCLRRRSRRKSRTSVTESALLKGADHRRMQSADLR